ncbi:hypothetical protein L596_008210 [Steinernema carpocapsae]|uniref:Sushi domain-containing protein n=1 Tax=Steinernema carpocapsae TaxID=34508 RepID=A0A4U5PBS4_STECR|nr:hypothetical protein L596_008210 [Steinernema carpocapsae]
MVSPWQCGQSAMEILTVHGENCFVSPRSERLDWISAQKRCLDIGGSLPLRIGNGSSRALKASLGMVPRNPSFYWIGLMGSEMGWSWVDGDRLDTNEQDWSESTPPSPSQGDTPLAAVLGRPVGWKWMTAAQNVWNSWICQTKPKFCTSPGVGEYGKVVFSSQSYTVGTFAFYSCTMGYRVRGATKRQCLPSGRWSHSIPACEPIDCGTLSEFSKGKIVFLNKTTTYGSVADYRCTRGFELDIDGPSSRRTCTADGIWSGREPQCKEIDCGPPPQSFKALVHFTETTFKSSAIYACDENTRMVGHAKIFCTESKSWQPSPPVCYDLSQLPSNDSSETNLVLMLIVLFLLLLLIAFAVIASRGGFHSIKVLHSKWTKDNIPQAPLVYATPSTQAPGTPSSTATDSIVPPGIVPMTQMEIPAHLIHLQKLPNGNFNVTMPVIRPQAMQRPGIPLALNPSNPVPSHSVVSPTPSQLLYSFDHEPLYDTPPENIYEELTQHTVC